MTPTSATGRLSSPPRQGREAGFSLVELMVVLAIVGLMGAAVVLTVAPRSGTLSAEADRFAGALMEARDTALIANRRTAMLVDEGGYRLQQLSGGVWAPVAGRGLAGEWDEETVVTPRIGDLPASIEFDPVGLVEARDFVLRRADDEVFVSIDGSGNIRFGDPDAW